MPWSEERKRKFSERMRGHKVSEETRAKLRGMSEETKARLRQINFERFKNPENRKIISEKLRGRKCSEETRAKISQKVSEYYKDPEKRKILSDKLRESMQARSEETRAKRRQYSIDLWKNPDVRRRIIDKLSGRKRSEGARANIRQGIIERFKNTEKRKIRAEQIRQKLWEERITLVQLPMIRETDFLAINTTETSSIREHFNPFIRQLHTFLNQLPCLYDIQPSRLQWNKVINYTQAFGNFVIKPYHWYTYNHGGRREAQFNLGFCKDYFRIGLGFEFTKATQSDPTIVHETYGSFLKVIQQDLSGFQDLVRQNYLEVEWARKHDNIPRIVNTGEAIQWLLNPDSNAIWIFIGRLLTRDHDALILADSVALGNVIESVFKGFRPIWEKTQIMVKESEKAVNNTSAGLEKGGSQMKRMVNIVKKTRSAGRCTVCKKIIPQGVSALVETIEYKDLRQYSFFCDQDCYDIYEIQKKKAQDKCDLCRIKFPDYLIAPFRGGKKTIQKCCPICALRLKNTALGLPIDTPTQEPTERFGYDAAVEHLTRGRKVL